MALSEYEMSVASKPANYRRLDGLLHKLRTDPGLRILRHAKAHLWTDWLNEAVENNSAIDFLEEFILRYADDNELIENTDPNGKDLPEEAPAGVVAASPDRIPSTQPVTTFRESPAMEWPSELPVFAVEPAPQVAMQPVHADEPLVGFRVLVIGGPETLIAEEEAILGSLGAAVVSVRSFSEAIGRMLRAPADLMLINEPTVDGWRSQNMAAWLKQNRSDWLGRMLFTSAILHAEHGGAAALHCMLQPFSSAELLACVAAMRLIAMPSAPANLSSSITAQA